ncbi:MAG: hypothetical protein ACRCZO_15435 [Cetobacterium sp.]
MWSKSALWTEVGAVVQALQFQWNTSTEASGFELEGEEAAALEALFEEQ